MKVFYRLISAGGRRKFILAKVTPDINNDLGPCGANECIGRIIHQASMTSKEPKGKIEVTVNQTCQCNVCGRVPEAVKLKREPQAHCITRR